ncbi:MAG: glutaredoxin family protein [Pseudomonadota bacterium]
MNIETTWRRGALLGLALLLCAASASAQLYKWVDASGKTHFSDTPPPETAKQAKVNSAPVGSVSGDMPYALTTAMRSHPVTLYTTTSCSGCDSGRNYLRARGIPFTEKTVTNADDEARLRAAGGDGNLPLLVVGSAKSTGYQQNTWDAMLTSAQYPATKILPSTYRYPAAMAAAPSAAKPAAQDKEREAASQAAADAEEAEARAKALAPQTAPPGFRF